MMRRQTADADGADGSDAGVECEGIANKASSGSSRAIADVTLPWMPLEGTSRSEETIAALAC